MKRIIFGILPILFATTAMAQEPPAEVPQKRFSFQWDFLARYDEVDDFTAPVPVDFDRTWFRLRPGLTFDPTPFATIEARAAIHQSSKNDDDFRLADGSFKRTTSDVPPGFLTEHLMFTGRQDNFEQDSVVLDRLNLQLRPTEAIEIFVGKFENPFDTTEALWDNDLQPEGLAATFSAGTTLRSRFAVGGYAGTQLYGDESLITAVQYTLSGDETWPVTFDVSLGYTDFEDLDVLARRNRRSNSTIGTGSDRLFASDFEIGNVLVRFRSDRWIPLEIYHDQIRNFGAAKKVDRDGFESGIKLGQLAGLGTWRLSVIYQDLGRDAVMAGFNGDDWYLHSWYRGFLYRGGIGLPWNFAIQGTYVDFEHHDTTYDTTRVMVDLLKRF